MLDLLARPWFQVTALVPVYLLFAVVPVRAELPTSQQLIRQTEEACQEFDKRTGDRADWPLSELAKARAYLGDHAGAMRTAQSIANPLWRNATLLICWELHFDLTGTIAELPDAADESEFEQFQVRHSRVEMAKILARAGRLADAEKLLPQDKDQDDEKARLEARLALMDFHLSLAEDQAQRGDRLGAAASLQRAWASLGRLPERMWHVPKLEPIGHLWLRLGNLDQARVVTEAAVKQARDRGQRQAPHLYAALDWGRIGKLQARLGQNDRARESFGEALRLVEASDRRVDNEDHRDASLRTTDYVEAVGQIGAWQFAAGFKNEAAESYGKVIARAGTIVEDDRRDHHMLNLLRQQCNEGDIEGSLQTIAQMQGASWQALGYCRCAEKLAADNQQPAGQKLRAKAEALADTEPEPKNSAHMLAEIAEAAAKADDLPAAKRCLDKALQISRATGNEHHQWIARCQVRVGLLEAAYETTRAIPEFEMRILPLAELTREAAKREAARGRKTQ